MNDTEKQQQRIKEFMQLLPLTSVLAGLSESEHGRYFTPEQMEARSMTIKQAYKVARQMLIEITSS